MNMMQLLLRRTLQLINKNEAFIEAKKKMHNVQSVQECDAGNAKLKFRS